MGHPKAKETLNKEAIPGQGGLVLEDHVTEKFAKSIGNRDTSTVGYFTEYPKIIMTSQ